MAAEGLQPYHLWISALLRGGVDPQDIHQAEARAHGVARVASTVSDAVTDPPRAGPWRRETEDRQEEEHA